MGITNPYEIVHCYICGGAVAVRECDARPGEPDFWDLPEGFKGARCECPAPVHDVYCDACGELVGPGHCPHMSPEAFSEHYS